VGHSKAAAEQQEGVMPITSFAKERRKNYLGSSDVSKILGVDPYGNAYDVWLEKTDKIEPEKKKDDGVMFAGTIFEDGLLNYASRELGPLTRNQFRVAKGLDFPLAANVDAILNDSGLPVEAKTAGLFGPLIETFGDPLTDQVPDRIITQTHVHMLCTERELCHVPTFLGGRGFCRFIVNRDQELIDAILEHGHNFWHKNVLGDTPPENLTPNLNLVKRLRKIPELIVDLDPVTVAVWQTMREARLAAEKQEREAQAAVLAALGEAEAGRVKADESEFMLTYFESTRAAHEVKESTYRTLRVVKPKAEKKAKAA
jgi:putative phage-type endonuclease